MANDAQITPQVDAALGTTTTGYRFVYLYYIKPNSNYHRDTEVYLIDQKTTKVITPADIYEFVRQIEFDEIEPLCYKIEHLPWHYLSYAVFVTRNAPNPWKVEFIYTGWGGGNHNFYRIGTISSGTLSGSWFENRRLRKAGGPLQNETEKFKVKFPGLHAMRSSRSANLLAGLIIKILILIAIMEPLSHNETGSNIGP